MSIRLCSFPTSNAVITRSLTSVFPKQCPEHNPTCGKAPCRHGQGPSEFRRVLRHRFCINGPKAAGPIFHMLALRNETRQFTRRTSSTPVPLTAPSPVVRLAAFQLYDPHNLQFAKYPSQLKKIEYNLEGNSSELADTTLCQAQPRHATPHSTQAKSDRKTPARERGNPPKNSHLPLIMRGHLSGNRPSMSRAGQQSSRFHRIPITTGNKSARIERRQDGSVFTGKHPENSPGLAGSPLSRRVPSCISPPSSAGHATVSAGIFSAKKGACSFFHHSIGLKT